MPLPSAEPLFAALCALRDACDPRGAEHGEHWRVVVRWLSHAFPGDAPELEDARQETFLVLLRHVGRMRAESAAQAAAWVARIHRTKRIDVLRARRRDPIRQALSTEPRDPEATPLLERIASEDDSPLSPGALQGLLDTVLDHVHRALEQSVASASKRELRRTQAHATLLRLVCGWDSDRIAAALDVGEPLSKDRLYKWVERGRASVHLGLDRWEAGADPQEREAIAPALSALREIVDARREDAGRPRPERTSAAKGEPSDG